MGCYAPYVLPTIDFVGGETLKLIFHVYYQNKPQFFDLVNTSANFSIVDYANKHGTPILSKAMNVSFGETAESNYLSVTIHPAETVELYGKYIYQITLKDADGTTEIPKQGIMYITNNIDKAFTLA